MNNPLMMLLSNLIQMNPNVRNNPRNAEMLNVVMSGDSAKGEEIARNLCKTYGTTPEEATSNAKQFFNLK